MKAILLIDKPESCTGCMLGIYNRKWFCLATNKDIDITDRYNIPEWCQLKPMPQKIESGKIEDGTKTNIPIPVEHFAMGWNACIEEIEKNVREAEHD